MTGETAHRGALYFDTCGNRLLRRGDRRLVAVASARQRGDRRLVAVAETRRAGKQRLVAVLERPQGGNQRLVAALNARRGGNQWSVAAVQRLVAALVGQFRGSGREIFAVSAQPAVFSGRLGGL